MHDAGAYCMAMASTYNLRMRPPEYWVCFLFLLNMSYLNLLTKVHLLCQEPNNYRHKGNTCSHVLTMLYKLVFACLLDPSKQLGDEGMQLCGRVNLLKLIIVCSGSGGWQDC